MKYFLHLINWEQRETKDAINIITTKKRYTQLKTVQARNSKKISRVPQSPVLNYECLSRFFHAS